MYPSDTECNGCPYFWFDEQDGVPYAHCQWLPRCPGDYAPCEFPDDLEDPEYTVGPLPW